VSLSAPTRAVAALAAALVAGAVGLGLALAGCGSGDPSATRTPPGGSAASSTAPTGSASGTPSGPLAVHEVGSVAVPSGNVGPLRVGGGAVVFPFATDPAAGWTRVGLMHAGDRTPTTVARSQWPHGLVNWVAADGDWVAWVDQSAEQSDATPKVLWRVWALDTTTNQKVLLASNGRRADPYVPIVLGQDGWFFWTRAETDRTAREQIWKPGDDAPTDLLRHVEMTPGSESVSGDRLVYLGPAATASRGHTVGGDCWSVPVTGGTPEPLTHSALAMGCAAAGDVLTWSQHIAPDTAKMPALGLLDDPYTVWSQPLSGGRATRLHQGYVLSSPLLAGDGFVSWDPDGRRVVRSLSTDATVMLPKGSVSIRSAASGRDLAWVTGGAGRPATVHLAEVTGG